MTDINDIPLSDIKIFLAINGKDVKDVKNITTLYNVAFELMQDPTTSYKNVPISIIQWMKAYNLILNKIDIPTYTLNEIEQLDTKELSELAKLLTMKTTNINSVINILIYMDKLYDDDIILNNMIFPKEVAKNILSNMDYATTYNVLSASKNINKLLPDYKNWLHLGAISRELKYVNYNTRKYYNSDLYDLKPGDRVFNYLKMGTHVNMKNRMGGRSKIKRKIYLYRNNKNYIVISSNNNSAKLKHVDVSGNIIDDNIIYISVRRLEGKVFWETQDGYRIRPGILLMDKGPLIENIDSIYLKYKTVPYDIFVENPELDMMVTVKSNKRYQKLLYVIKNLKDDYMSLDQAYFDDFPDLSDLPRILYVYKIDDEWKIDNSDISEVYDEIFSIEKIGGYMTQVY
jgi:hypothetical protein